MTDKILTVIDKQCEKDWITNKRLDLSQENIGHMVDNSQEKQAEIV